MITVIRVTAIVIVALSEHAACEACQHVMHYVEHVVRVYV